MTPVAKQGRDDAFRSSLKVPATPSQELEATIAIDARYLNGDTSGIGRYTEHLIRQLLALEPRLNLRLITAPGNPEPFEGPRVRCETFSGPPNSLRTFAKLARSVDLRGVDLFHSPFNILPMGLPCPATMTLHDIMWLIDPDFCTDALWRKVVTGTFYQQLIPPSAHRAAGIFTVSHHSREAIEGYFPSLRGKVTVTYNGLDDSFFPTPPEQAWPLIEPLLHNQQPFVLAVGQGSPYKNHAGALGGFLHYLRSHPRSPLRFVLVRRFLRGPARELNRLMSAPEARDRVVLLEGGVSGEQLRALYSMASAFLFPSLYEGFGMPALEAMACGAPVVSSSFGAPAEIAGQAAAKADARDPAQIGLALASILDDPQRAEELRRLGVQRAREFSWESCARTTAGVWAEILGNRNRNGR